MCEEWTSKDFLVTETTVNPELSPDRLIAILRERKTTGQLTFHLSQGGLQKVALTEKTKADATQSQGIRELLGME